jgi:hypothetical protein
MMWPAVGLSIRNRMARKSPAFRHSRAAYDRTDHPILHNKKRL